jgi:hypothetical protein
MWLGIKAGLPTPLAVSAALLGSALLFFAPSALVPVKGELVPELVNSAAAAVLSSREASVWPQSGELASTERASTESASAARAELERESAALIERWAPSFAQEVSVAHPERDRPLRIDFDGDWDATNNWEHLTPEAERASAAAYASAILTRTHAYLTFTLFYPRDWIWPACVSYICHDNDLEVVLLTVQRRVGSAEEQLVFVETKAHSEYVALHASELSTDPAGRPWIRIESQGHGMYPLRRAEPVPTQAIIFSSEAGPTPTSLEARGQRNAESYQLLSLHQLLWARRDPSSRGAVLWTSGESGFLAYAGARQGRRGFLLGVSMQGSEYEGGVRPPWGLKADVGERGDWFLDPAYVAQRRHGDWLAASGPSEEYVLNPFLDDLTRECSALRCPPILPLPSPRPARAGVAGGALLLMGLFSLNARRRGRARWPRFGRRSRVP